MAANVRVTTSVVAEVHGDGADGAYLKIKASLQQEAEVNDLVCNDQTRTCSFNVVVDVPAESV